MDPEPKPEPQPEPSHEALPQVGPSVPRIYANGFGLGLTNADANLVLQQNGQPIALVFLSYTLAKTLSLRLGRLVAEWETRTGQQLMTTDKLDAAFAKDPAEGTKQ